ncbi:MAG: polysaccharide pyruvyl transferase CsaB [Actinobacteria bacterium]|nr:polysaccharide pyruvyl transferase CsaB [Actinomycetota bacterium]
MKKVLISGYYGFGNIGDEAILSAMVALLRAEIPGIEITVASSNPRETEERYRIRAIPRSINAIRRAMKTSDLFISGGGGLLQDVTSMQSLVYYCLLLLIARAERVPVMIYGQGVGPVRRFLSKLLVRLAVSGANVITVRDRSSKKILEDIGVRRDIIVTSDPALLLRPMHVSRLDGLQRPIVGLALRDWRGFNLDSIARAADEISSRVGASVAFIPFHPKRDYLVAERIAARMKEHAHIINGIDLPSEVLSVIGEMDALVGMRLHSIIFACLQGTPFFPIAYDSKIEEFLAAIGVSKPISCRDIRAEEIVAGVENLLSLGGGWGYPIEGLRIRAKQNAILAKQLLKERQILGIRFDALEMDEAIGIIEDYIKERTPHLVVTLNAEMMVMAQKDQGFRSVLNEASLLVPDSIGIVWAGKLRTRVPGIDMIDELAKKSVYREYRIFMIGSKEGVAEKAAAELTRRYPGLKIIGARSGYFSKEDEAQLVEEIREASPDILFVGLGMGKQEKWIAQYLDFLGVPVCLGVGGSFDVIAGEVKRAPIWIRHAGLEWLYRFIQQPTRLKRMLALPKFVYMVVRERGLM